jgi:hypothetical protein
VTLNINGTQREVPVSKLSASDQELVRGLRAIPANVKIAPAGKGNAFNVAVIKAFAQLSATNAGSHILQQLAGVAQGQVDYIRGQKVTLAPCNTDAVTIQKSAGENHTTFNGPSSPGRPATNVILRFNPTGPTGDKVVGDGSTERPPYVALAKELHVAFQALSGDVRSDLEMDQISRVEENKLRRELKLPDAEMPRKRE